MSFHICFVLVLTGLGFLCKVLHLCGIMTLINRYCSHAHIRNTCTTPILLGYKDLLIFVEYLSSISMSILFIDVLELVGAHTYPRSWL